MSNRIPQVVLVFDRYKKASSTHRASVEVRITYNYKQKYISTGVMVYSHQWRKGTVVNSPDASQLNTILNNFIIEVREAISRMSERGYLNIMDIPNEMQRKRLGTISFLDFIYQRISVRKYGKSKSRQKRYDYFYSFLQEWNVIREFADVTEANIILFDECLKKKNLTAYTKWHNYHEFLSSFITDAINAGYLKKNPYQGISIEKGSCNAAIHKYLTLKEFKRLMKAKLPTASLERVRDLFVFQTYTCLSYNDLEAFDSSKISTVNGMKIYTGKRHKTNKPFTIPLLPPVLAILDKYNSKPPVISNVKYNAYLKAVAQFAKIDKPLTSHWARHTGATMLLNEGIDMRIVSKICGHSSTKITEQVYAKLLDETVVEALKNVDI